jgi:hypothetical protein
MKAVNQKLVEEGERLDQIGEDLKSTFGILKQANKFLTELAKDYYKDKCIVGMSILILLLIITVVVVGIVKKSKASTAVAPSIATNTTNTTTVTPAANATALIYLPISVKEWRRLPPEYIRENELRNVRHMHQ